MARPSGWDILGLDGDPTPGVVESVQSLAKEFGDFAHDVESAYRNLNSFGSDTAALQWVGQTAEAFKSNYGPLPGRLQKLYTSYSEASDALSAYWPQLQAAQAKADSALRQAQDAQVDLQRATTTATNAAADLKTAQQNHAASPNPQAVADAQTAHDTAQTNLNNAKAKMSALTAQANQAHDERITAAKACAKAIGHAQSDGIHNKHWWEHVGEALSEWGGKIAEIANDIAPVLDVLAIATSWIPGVDVVTAGLAEADNLIALAGTGLQIAGDAMQGHWGDALLGAGMLGVGFLGGKALAKFGGKALDGLASKFGKEAEGTEENAIGAEARTAEGAAPAGKMADPVDVVSGWMLTDATDLELPGTLPVILRRAYASGYATGHLFGPGWSSTLDQRISINEAGIHFAGDDTQRLDYPIPAAADEVLPRRGSRWPLVWDREADEIRITDPWSGQTRHFGITHFQNELGQIRDLTAITDRNGNRISVTRDEQGTPTLIEHPGYCVAVDTIATVAGPRISALRLLAADSQDDTVVKRYAYDERGRLIGVINSSGLPFSYEWDEHDRITAWRDRAGYRYGYVYDQLDRVVRGEGIYLAGSFQYDPASRTTVFANSLGHITTYVYDEHGHVTSETDALGNITSTMSDQYGRVLSRTDALGNITTLQRDGVGDIHRMVTADGSVVEFDHNQFHQVVSATYPDGAEWLHRYDERGNLISVTDPRAAVVEFAYSGDGALTMVTDQVGAITRFTNDRAGLPLSVLDPLGGLTRADRDSAGRVVRATNPTGATTTFEWNAEGQPVARTGPDGARTLWHHDESGRLVQIVDPAGATTVFEPGPVETLRARTGPDGVRHTFAYDSELNLVEVGNPAGASWRYHYDAAGRLTSETDFIGRTLAYEYDAAGQLAIRTTRAGQQMSLERDAAGNVVALRTPDGDYHYSYDSTGHLATAAGLDNSVSFEYDPLGRVVAETVDGRTMRYGYDPAGRLIRRITASGIESTWTYDAAGRPTGLDAGDDHLAFRFDAAGREIERLFGAGASFTRGYDAAGRLIRQDLGVASQAGDISAEDLFDGSAHSMRSVFNRTWVWRPDGVPEELRTRFAALHGGSHRIMLAGSPP
jgi:YD repeat-containing protein